jgi:hypothetical protein
VQCGLKGCRKRHNHGYWVATEDGFETNIGGDCGANFFPEFESRRDEYTERRARQEAIERFDELRRTGGQIESSIRRIMLHAADGMDWVKKGRAALQDVIGQESFRKLEFHQRRGLIEVRVERERTDAEVDQVWELNRRRGSKEQFRMEERTVGSLAKAQWTYYDYRHELVKGVLDHLVRLRDKDPQVLSTTTIQRHVRPLSGWEQKVQQAQAMSEECKDFMSNRNLEMLSLWVKDTASKRKLQEFIQRGARDRLLKLANEQLVA